MDMNEDDDVDEILERTYKVGQYDSGSERTSLIKSGLNFSTDKD